MLVAAALFAVALILRAALNNVTSYSRADETVYLGYAKRGLGAFRSLVCEFIAGAGDTPTPLRFGWIGLAQLTHATTHRRLAWISTVFGAAAVPVTYWLAHSWVAAILVCISPLGLGMSRRALQDAAVGTLTLLVLLAAARGSCIGVGVALTVLLSVKEVSLLGYPAFGALLYLSGGGVAGTALALFLPIVVFVGAVVALNRGTLGLETIARKMTRQQAFPYALAYGRGPLHSYLVQFALLSPIVAVLAARGWTWSPLEIALSLYVGAWSLQRFWNYRFFGAGDALLRIVTATSVSTQPAPWNYVLLGACVVWDLWIFRRVFLQRETYDPMFYNVVKSLDMVP